MFKKSEVKRKSLKSKLDIVYAMWGMAIVIGFGFFYTSKLFFADESDLLFTQIGEEFSINATSKFTINEWIYDEESNKMQITLITSNLTDHLSDLNFISVSKKNLQKELPVRVVYNTRDIFIIMIDDVPKNFDQVVLRLVKEEIDFDHILALDNPDALTKEEQESIQKNIIANVYTDERVVDKGEVRQQRVNSYALKVTNELIEMANEERELYMTELQKNTLMISRIQEEIALLKEELIYQTVSEQDETNNKIFSLEKEIEDIESNNETILTNVDAVDSKKERLEQRKRDLQF